MPGGPDPIPGFVTAGADFGAWHQRIPLYYYDAINQPPGWDYSGFQWVNDASFRGGGYVGATADASYFTCLVLLAPKGSIWQLNISHSDGPDFGRIRVQLASMLYESASRPSGDPTGKIGPVDGSYGSFTYVDLNASPGFDTYSATPGGDHASGSSLPFIVGGDEGDPLTDILSAPTDPFTGRRMMDGGPGWYRLKIHVSGKNASSSGYKVRISDVLLNRRADDNAP